MNQLSSKKMTKISRKKKKGFTLVELIIVIAIIAVLAAMAIPRFSAVRLDARVSNDVAAAKNIATQVATLVANGDITAGTTVLTDTTAGSDAMQIKARLEGRASTGNTEALTGGHFEVDVAANEAITVRAVGGTVNDTLYPDNNGALRVAYTADVD